MNNKDNIINNLKGFYNYRNQVIKMWKTSWLKKEKEEVNISIKLANFLKPQKEWLFLFRVYQVRTKVLLTLYLNLERYKKYHKEWKQ